MILINMALKWPNLVRVACLSVAFTPALACAQADHGGTVPNKPRKQSEGLVEYTLKRVNPSDKNYGQAVDQGRAILVAETIDNGYFWSNVVTLGLLLGFFFVIVFQHKLLKRRAVIAAEALCQYQNVLARAEAHAAEATRRNHELMDALRSASDTGPRRQEPSVPKEAPAVRAPAQASAGGERENPRTNKGGAPSSATSATQKTAQTNTAGAAEVPRAADGTPAQAAPMQSSGLDLVAQNNAIQQQLGLTQDLVRQLRRQLNESERQLQAEKQKNRTVKGE